MKIIILCLCLSLCSCSFLKSLIPTGSTTVKASIGKDINNSESLINSHEDNDNHYKNSNVNHHYYNDPIIIYLLFAYLGLLTFLIFIYIYRRYKKK